MQTANMSKRKETEELLVIQKLYDYLVWISPLINRFPRDRKFTIGDRILNRLYDVLEDLIKAKYRRNNKIDLLEQANVGLEIATGTIRTTGTTTTGFDWFRKTLFSRICLEGFR